MTSILHLTDPHFDHCTKETMDNAGWKIIEKDPSLVLITGDLSEAPKLENHINLFKNFIPNIPVFFVLGNHDYYDGSIVVMRDKMKKYAYPQDKKEPGKIENGLWYLGHSGYIPLSMDTVLIGHDGWYDGLYSNWYDPSVVEMCDYEVIRELNNERHYRPFLHKKLQELAKESADYIKNQLESAFNDGYEKAFVGTHIPPFKQNSVYAGRISNHQWLPNFSSKIMGDMLLDVMQKYPNKSCTVLCGHSHGKAHYVPLSNLECITQPANYGHVVLGKMFNV